MLYQFTKELSGSNAKFALKNLDRTATLSNMSCQCMKYIVKPFECQICSSKFGLKNKLKNHVQTVHDNIKAFTCEICLSKFGQNANLKRHVLSVHENRKPYHCQICSTSFNRKVLLETHVLKIHTSLD
jgi:KRAB domain-containing zinc finger protein